MGAKVGDVPLDPAIGRNLPSLSVELGTLRFNAVEDPGMAIVLIFSIQPGDEVIRAANNLSRENQEKVLLLLKTALMENQRLAWALQPPTVTALGELRGIQLTQRFRVREDDPSTYNRFHDAFQELVTAQVKIQILYESTVGARPRTKADAGPEAYRGRFRSLPVTGQTAVPGPCLTPNHVRRNRSGCKACPQAKPSVSPGQFF